MWSMYIYIYILYIYMYIFSVLSSFLKVGLTCTRKQVFYSLFAFLNTINTSLAYVALFEFKL